MKPQVTLPIVCVALLSVLLTGCATPPQPRDYTNYRAHHPRSILILPPLNETTSVNGPYSFLSTVTIPVAERGYYVFPVAVVDQFLKENGLPTPGEMHQAPLEKIKEIIGADAVLYIVLKQYGSKYAVIDSTTTVEAAARLVDTTTATLLWEGSLIASDSEDSTGDLIGDMIFAIVDQIIDSSTDKSHGIARQASFQLTLPEQGLLYGPYHPKFGTD